VRRGRRRTARPVLGAFRPVLGALLLVLVAGCSGKPPEISRVFARVIYSIDAGAKTGVEKLGVFLVASDADGLENLSAFYVINDDAELFWKVDSAAWITSTAEGETWIGTSSLAMPDGGPIPAGTCRVVLQDVGGETVESTITVPARTTTAAKAKYPTASVKDGLITVAGTAQGFEVWVYRGDGGFVAAFPVAQPVRTFALRAVTDAYPTLVQGFTYRVFSWDESAGYGVLSVPYTISTDLPRR
jgi:hypothetical protein